MNIRDEVMQLPADLRLPYALERLEELLGDDVAELAALIAQGLTQQQARMVLVLSAAAPRPVSRDAIFDALASAARDSTKIVDVLASQLRRAGIDVKSVWGVGYRLLAPVQVQVPPAAGVRLTRGERHPAVRPGVVRVRHGAPWSAAEDADLRAMVGGGWVWSAIADELDRTERSCAERWRAIR